MLAYIAAAWKATRPPSSFAVCSAARWKPEIHVASATIRPKVGGISHNVFCDGGSCGSDVGRGETQFSVAGLAFRSGAAPSSASASRRCSSLAGGGSTWLRKNHDTGIFLRNTRNLLRLRADDFNIPPAGFFLLFIFFFFFFCGILS